MSLGLYEATAENILQSNSNESDSLINNNEILTIKVLMTIVIVVMVIIIVIIITAIILVVIIITIMMIRTAITTILWRYLYKVPDFRRKQGICLRVILGSNAPMPQPTRASGVPAV